MPDPKKWDICVIHIFDPKGELNGQLVASVLRKKNHSCIRMRFKDVNHGPKGVRISFKDLPDDQANAVAYDLFVEFGGEYRINLGNSIEQLKPVEPNKPTAEFKIADQVRNKGGKLVPKKKR
jgi:hypothetical protein